MNYYPFGAQFCDGSANNNDVQPYKYNGKELDKMHGLNTYDYGARQYNPITARWDRMDPMAEKYYSVSPYAYCANNPVMLVDPDGCDVYYSNTGEFLYRDDKKTDNIIIRNQFLYDLKSMTGAEWINPDMNIIDSSLSAESYSKIFTDILDKNGFDTNMLKNGQVSIVKLKYNSKGDGPQYEADGFFNHEAIIPYRDASIAQTKHINGKYEITAYRHPMGDSNREYLSTESNVVSVLGVHEFEGHGHLNISGEQHWIILENQRKHSSWKKVSPKLKALYRYFETNKIDNYNKPI
jgi:RHS repeat-associated protein